MLPSLVKGYRWALILSLILVCTSFKTLSNDLPANLQVVLLSKLLPYEKGLSEKLKVSVFVVRNQEVFQAFKLLKAKQQNQQLGEIGYGERLPEHAYDVVYLDDQVNLSDALIYSFKYASLLVTNDIDRVKAGITLGLSVKNGRPMFFLNKKSSDATGLSWDPLVLDSATLFD